jgi:hypothetical protein
LASYLSADHVAAEAAYQLARHRIDLSLPNFHNTASLALQTQPAV